MLTIAVTQENARVPVAVMSLEGELDAASYLDALASAREVVEGGASHILLDLEQLSYMGSSGIFVIHSVAMLLRGEEPPNPEGGWDALHQADEDDPSEVAANLKLLSPQPQVDRALERSGMKRSSRHSRTVPKPLRPSEVSVAATDDADLRQIVNDLARETLERYREINLLLSGVRDDRRIPGRG